MALTITYVPGYVWTIGELVTEDKLNQAANPTINLEGTISSSSVADGAITTPKLAAGVLSADATGRSKMADLFITLAKINTGIFTADATGRGKFADGFNTATQLDESARGSVHQYATGAFVAGVYAVTLSPAATVYTAGMVVRFKADLVNTGATDINVNALGAKNLFNSNGGELLAGDIPAGALVTAVYDGTNFQIQKPGEYTSTTAGTIAAGLSTFAHGLGVVPRFVRAVFICTTNQAPWVVGDEIDVDGLFDNSGQAPRVSVWANATNVVVAVYGTDIRVVSATATFTNLTAGSFKIKVHARL